MTRVLTIVAHEDDDLLFVNPDIQDNINNGDTCETLFVTAGDASREDGYWQSRERGMGAAYAQMIGVDGVGVAETITMLEHQATRYEVKGHPNISLVFLRITDPLEGKYFMGLKNIWEGSLESIITMDGTPSYTKQQLIDVLHDRMVDFKPDIIRTLDCMIPFGDNDHTTHTAVAYFANAAHSNYTRPHTFMAYRGYGTKTMTPNVEGDGLAAKQAAYFAYDPFDIGKKCSDEANCGDPDLLAWMKRKYITCREERLPVKFEVLEGDGNSLSHREGDIGQMPATVEFAGNLYVFYFDTTAGHLRYATADAATPPTWIFGAVDTGGEVGQNPSVAVYENALHVFYYDLANGELRHARSTNGTAWTVQSLDGDAGSVSRRAGDVGVSSTAVVYKNALHVFYYGNDGGNLRHAWLAGTMWDFEDLDGTETSISQTDADTGFDSVAVVYKNELHVFYYDATHELLRHAWLTGAGEWRFEDLDGQSEEDGRTIGPIGLNPAVAVHGDTLHLFYTDHANGCLRHAWSNESGWRFEILDGTIDAITRYVGNVGATPAAVVHDGMMHVVAYAPEEGNLRHYWTSHHASWQVERLDGAGDDDEGGRTDGDVGIDASVITYGSRVHFFYYDSTHQNLRHAIWGQDLEPPM